MGNRLYVGNLPFDATEKQIQKAFEAPRRKVTSIKIVADRETGKSRGFGNDRSTRSPSLMPCSRSAAAHRHASLHVSE